MVDFALHAEMAGKCAKCGHYKDTPMHELGCAEKPVQGRVKAPAPETEWLAEALWGDGALFDQISRTMQERQAKYGPGNISRHGLTGILVRLDDKLARIQNGDADFEDERYEDAWLDVVGYGLIALMWIRGQWSGSPYARKD